MANLLNALSRRRKVRIRESSTGERIVQDVAEPAVMPDTASIARETVDLYSTEGSTGMKFIADPQDAIVEYDPEM